MSAGVLPVPAFADFAARRGLKYDADADERWIRAWEPYATLKVPVRYEHAMQATGEVGSVTIARMVTTVDAMYGGVQRTQDVSSWIVIAQDVRMTADAAATSDPKSPFAEPLDLVSTPRRATGDAAFDRVFASFAKTPEALAAAINPSVRKLTLGWRVPLHFEIRKGGFVLAPVALGADPMSLTWLVEAVHLFGAKAAKSA